MVNPVDCDDRLCEAAYLVEYDLPPYGKIDDSQSLAKARREASFRAKLRSNPKYGNVFVTQTNLFFHNEKPPSNWTWKNTRKLIRDVIVRGLKNRGELVIREKEKLMKQIYLVEKHEDRSRILKSCNDELEYVWYLLDAFSCFDEGIKKLCVKVDDVWSVDPFIRIVSYRTKV